LAGLEALSAGRIAVAVPIEVVDWTAPIERLPELAAIGTVFLKLRLIFASVVLPSAQRTSGTLSGQNLFRFYKRRKFPVLLARRFVAFFVLVGVTFAF
jgi:hypothetical protein